MFLSEKLLFERFFCCAGKICRINSASQRRCLFPKILRLNVRVNSRVGLPCRSCRRTGRVFFMKCGTLFEVDFMEQTLNLCCVTGSNFLWKRFCIDTVFHSLQGCFRIAVCFAAFQALCQHICGLLCRRCSFRRVQQNRLHIWKICKNRAPFLI